jgi:uracil-DNA glycosylase family 4
MKRKPSHSPVKKPLVVLQEEIINCRSCSRLVEWREKVAVEKVRRFQGEEYWGMPVPSFGDRNAKLLVLGLAPAAHGGNRTGRMFTGDRSGDWLYRALHREGFANQAISVNRQDGLQLNDCYISAVLHCAPPDNQPLPGEIRNCRPFLLREIAALKQLRVIVALGRLAFDTALTVFHHLTLAEILQPVASHAAGSDVQKNSLQQRQRIRQAKPKFAHGAESSLSNKITLIASFHPSQQNTFTGRLTETMLDNVFKRAREIISTIE